MEDPGISVSVIIPSYNEVETISPCLSSLSLQTGLDTDIRVEIIVVDSSTDGTDALIKQKFPSIKLYHSEQKMYPGDARNYGVRHSNGEILAFLDADCRVEETWIRQVLDAYQVTQCPVLGGAIANGNPESYVGWGYYFSSFSQWMPRHRHEPFEIADLPSTFLACKRSVFEQCGPFLEGTLCQDTVFMWNVMDAGYKACFVPEIQIFHTNIDDFYGVVRRKVKHGKTFARLRVSEKQFSIFKQLLFAVGSLILPFLITYRRTKDIVLAQKYWGQFIVAMPMTLISIFCWSLGELLGYAEFKNDTRLHKASS